MGGADEEPPQTGTPQPEPGGPAEQQQPGVQPDPEGPAEQPAPPPPPAPDERPDRELPPIKFDDTLAYQEVIVRFLEAELDHSVRGYAVANLRLDQILTAASMAPPNSNERFLESVTAVTRAAKELNTSLLKSRNYASPGYRRPAPPELPEFNASVALLAFYEVAERALASDADQGVHLDTIRNAILYDPDTIGREIRPRDQLYRRYRHRRRIAEHVGHDTVAVAQAFREEEFALATLQDDDGSVAAEVLLALKQSHLLIHQVERRRSKPVGAMLERDKDDLDDERRLLEQSIVLSTLTFIVCNSVPWIFAADDEERQRIQDDPERRRHDPRTPMWSAPTPMWISRQVMLLSLYRRAHGFRLLGDHERSYHDHRKVQRFGLLARPGIDCSSPEESVRRNLYVDVLSALAEYRVGELYRADHDYMRALVHLCNGHDRLLTAGKPVPTGGLAVPAAKAVVRFPQIEVQLRLGKGNAFFETGAMKRALKWLVRAWSSLLVLIDLEGKPPTLVPLEPPPDREPDPCDRVAAYLERVKHDRELDKSRLLEDITPAIECICATVVPQTLHALAANVLGRLGHLLMVLRLDDRDTLGEQCLTRAAGLDPYNLFVRTSLLRRQLRAEDLRSRGLDPGEPVPSHDAPPDAMECWPSGASDVDQAIRVAEHLMLCSLLEAVREGSKGGDADVARALIGDFIAHTDSVNLRVEVLNRYLMRERDECQRPDLGELPPEDSYLEFVSLRRYGCYTPLLPRPAAVSAVGGGYLVRVCSPSENTEEKAQEIVNILVDPGDGVVKNLYRVGLGIGDIDMVIATHDHPDHVGALDAILSLREARHDMAPLLILGNASVVQRYQGYEQLTLGRLDGPGADDALPPWMSVRALHGRHLDLAGHHSVPFVLTYAPPDRVPRSITFMSDTATEAVGSYLDPRLTEIEVHEEWKNALESDIVVAHVSDVSVGELRELALLPDVPEVATFDERIKELLRAKGREKDAIRVMRALSLIPSGPLNDHGPRGLLDPGALQDNKDGPHLYLHGLLAVAKQMNSPPPGGVAHQPRVLVIGELREQLGSFRRTIAKEINEHVFGVQIPTVALTADIALRIRLDGERRNRVLCSICSMDNDRLDDERFHSPEKMIEVCVKGDHEANYWLCPIHNPSRSLRLPVFIEQMGGYDPFASGDRYHG
ncbi:MAG: hypothetical protein QOJ63_1676 [Solirubrobacteraceae bacterium]|jgi:hypothetical protein|nr:hypothetical protein [Solirubrobacteraceae bacterium]